MVILAGVKTIVDFEKRGHGTCDKISNGSVTSGVGNLKRCLAVLNKEMSAVLMLGAPTNREGKGSRTHSTTKSAISPGKKKLTNARQVSIHRGDEQWCVSALK
jgi:hypothetical protein